MPGPQGSTFRDSTAVPFLTPHRVAVAQALLVTLLWSSSYVLIKRGLESIPALTYAGLRYGLAAICLLAVLARSEHGASVTTLPRRDWGWLVGLGVLLYAVTQGAQFVALTLLPAVTVSLVLTFTPVVVATVGVAALDERPTVRQWVGVAVATGGALVYFGPDALAGGRALGLAVMAVGLLANAAAAVLGRHVNTGDAPPLVVTAVSMTVGAGVLLATGVAVQGLPALSFESWAIVAWLAVINTAFAFTLWNHTLQRLTATESSVLNNTMLVQIAILGWVFLGETLATPESVALAAVLAGTVAVQVGRRA